MHSLCVIELSDDNTNTQFTRLFGSLVVGKTVHELRKGRTCPDGGKGVSVSPDNYTLLAGKRYLAQLDVTIVEGRA